MSEALCLKSHPVYILVVYFFLITLLIAIVSVAAPNVLRLHQIYRSITIHPFYHRSHWFHLSLRRRKQLIAKNPYTVCITSPNGLAVCLVVTDDTTAGDILQLLIGKRLVPGISSQSVHLTSALHTDNHHSGRLNPSTKMGELDMDDSSHTHVRCLSLAIPPSRVPFRPQRTPRRNKTFRRAPTLSTKRNQSVASTENKSPTRPRQPLRCLRNEDQSMDLFSSDFSGLEHPVNQMTKCFGILPE
ncbi:uncharacterized protein STEHIDRAFT_164144 [Stereum hirsutum FP-91666 SS1]|uniref:Uncharacterized protein n=1 Tax=Stereum hirsutum (strain FP-91666) TaxID=721885 RepID=R7RVE8_STEHR|nr:uncharacterized protein STEHIDRAFT_164144 [Stereum hirsutum FP-91666 SS1]EIM78971.1 hypothetical protein STEHIDRAFT_164144 [Stereum hirsutum FP-91666 SS1]